MAKRKTAIAFTPTDERLKIDLTKSTLDDEVQYPRLTPRDEDGWRNVTQIRRKHPSN